MDILAGDTPTASWTPAPSSRPRVYTQAPNYDTLDGAPTQPPSRPRQQSQPRSIAPGEIEALLGELVAQLSKPEPTTGEKIAAWFKSPANWAVLSAAIWGVASGVLQARDQWRDTVSFRHTAIAAHKDIGASLKALRDEVIEMRGRDLGRRDEP